MKEIISLIFISTLAQYSYSQKDTISSEVEFKKAVYQCIDSLIEKDAKYSSIVGIKMELDLNGELKKYDITFKNKDQKLRRRNYNWLFHILDQSNYKNVAMLFYSPDDLKTITSMKVSIKYTCVEDR